MNHQSLLKEILKLSPQSKEIHSLLSKLNESLFNQLCFKSYLSECEPEYCSHRILNDCEYIKKRGEINNLLLENKLPTLP